MKIPASSSIILATLAISSSSTSLAAPTGSETTESAIVSSQSQGHVASEGGDGNVAERSMGDADLEARANGMVSDILAGLPIVGPLAKALLVKDCPPPNGASADEVSEVSEEDLARLQNAVDSVSSALSGIIPISTPLPLPSGAGGAPVSMIPAPGPVKSAIAGVADTNPDKPTDPASANYPRPSEDAGAAAAESSNADSSFLISPTATSVANAEEANESLAPSDSGSLSSDSPAAQATPTVPSGPPNTPAMPETTPDRDSSDQDQDPEAK